MRLFTGVELPALVSSRLEALTGRLRPHASIRWSPVSNLHITTKFIGEWPEQRLAELVSALRETHWGSAFEVGLESLGWFPNPHQPRIFWVRVEPVEPLAALAALTNQCLATLGIAPEAQRAPFAPPTGPETRELHLRTAAPFCARSSEAQRAAKRGSKRIGDFDLGRAEQAPFCACSSKVRAYHPHITLARINPRARPAVDLAQLRRAVAGMEPPELGRFSCSGFHLYESRQEKGGSVYTKLARFPLQQLP